MNANPDWMTAAERDAYGRRLREVDDAVRRAAESPMTDLEWRTYELERGPVFCPSHGAPLFVAPLGGPWLVCRHCLENVCEACERPESFCDCERNAR